MKFVRSCRVYTKSSDPFDTDHRLLVLDLQFPTTKKFLQHRLSRQNMKQPTPKTDLTSLKGDETVQRHLTSKLDDLLADHSSLSDVNELNDLIVCTVRQSVEEVCPKVEEVKKKEPWEDNTLKEQIKNLRSCHDHTQIRRIQKDIKKRRTLLKNQYYEELASNINSAAEAREIEKEFRLAKKFSMLKTGTKLAISNDNLKTHFKKHFAARNLQMPPEIERPAGFPPSYRSLYTH